MVRMRPSERGQAMAETVLFAVLTILMAFGLLTRIPDYRHPYTRKKKPQEQATLLGGYRVCKGIEISFTLREDH